MPEPQLTFAAAQRFAEQHRLHATNQQLAGLFQGCALPGRMGENAQRAYADLVARIATALSKDPFLAPPASVSKGDITLGTSGTIPVRLRLDEANQPLIVTGSPGSGKTTFLAHLAIQLLEFVTQLAQLIHLIVPDFKSDFPWLPCEYNDFISIEARTEWNILQHDLRIATQEHITRIMRFFGAATWGGELQMQAMHETLTEAYERHDPPSVSQWVDIVHSRTLRRLPPARLDAYLGLERRLGRFTARYSGLCQTQWGIPHQVLTEHSLYFGAHEPTDSVEFLTALSTSLFSRHAQLNGWRDQLRYVLFLDEGWLTLGAKNHIDGPALLPLIPLLREWGGTSIISTVHLGTLPEAIRALAYTTIVLPSHNDTELVLVARTMGLNPSQAAAATRMTRGQGIIRTGKVPHAFTFTFPPLNRNKAATNWESVIERTNALVPPHPEQVQPPVPPPAPVPTIVPTIPITPASTMVTPVIPAAPPRPALSIAAEVLLRAVIQEQMPTTTGAFRIANLTPAIGEKALNELLFLDCIERNKVTIRKGTGGTAQVLCATSKSFVRLNVRRPHGPRGHSSPQHTYLITTIAKEITRLGGTIMIEHRVGTKSIDLVYKPTCAAVNTIVETIATTLSGNPLSLIEGLVALEIETTSDTAVNNATQNLHAGITVHVAATMPKSLRTTRQRLTLELSHKEHDSVATVDVLELLDALYRKEHTNG